MQTGEMIIFQTSNGATSIEVKLEGDSVWLNQYQLAELFQTDRTALVKHIFGTYINQLSCPKRQLVQKLHKL